MTLSDYIKSDLQQRIESAGEIPEKLTLSHLAELYKVSTMPVRLALNELIDEQVLLKGDNGRLQINAARVKLSKSTRRQIVQPPTDWVKQVFDDAVRASLHGQAVQWKIAETAERYAISHVQVQTIFNRLAGSGVLVHTPRRGWWIRPFRKEDLNSYLDVRVLLELKALDASHERLERPVLEQLYEANIPANGKTPPRIDNRLHRYWVDLSGNRYIQDFFDRHGAYYTTLYAYASIGNQLLEEIAERHRRILLALMNKQIQQARETLSEDIQSLRSILTDTILQLDKRGPDSQ